MLFKDHAAYRKMVLEGTNQNKKLNKYSHLFTSQITRVSLQDPCVR